MPSLIAKTPMAGQAPVMIGAARLAEGACVPITSVSVLKGQEKPLAAALKSLGLAFPAPNTFVQKGAARMVWTGRDQAFLIDAASDSLTGLAALSDQSDGWAVLRLEGAATEAALMRLYPIDLRLSVFGVGHAARAPLNHMQSVLMRLEPQAFEVLVFRSMARTAWHEIAVAMSALAARAARPI